MTVGCSRVFPLILLDKYASDLENPFCRMVKYEGGTIKYCQGGPIQYHVNMEHLNHRTKMFCTYGSELNALCHD